MTTKKYRIEYQQQPEESYDDWYYRIMLNKAKKKIDLEWDEVKDILNASQSTEYLRKIGAGIAKYSDYLQDKSGLQEGNEALAEYISDEVATLRQMALDYEKEKMRMQDQKRELQKQKREWARAENIIRYWGEKIEKVNEKTPLCIKEKPTIRGKREAALLLSDWHKGLSEFNNWNQINDSIFRERIETLVNKTIEYCKDQKAGTLNCFLLGDLIHGVIHVTTRISATEDAVDQTTLAAEIIEQMLLAFSKKFKRVNVYYARGNHERVSPNIKDSIPKESFFDFIPWYLKMRFKNVKRVHFIDNTIDDEIITTEILGYKIFGVHGHLDNPKSVVQNLTLMVGEKPDYIFMGHYHKKFEDENGAVEIIGNSSLSGMDGYAKSKRLYSKPSQKLIIMDENEGRLCVYPIKLTA